MTANQDNTSLDTKEALLIASLKVFAQKGFDGATVKDIADEARVNVSLISYHFGGKEKLYHACLEGIASERLNACERMLKPCKTKEEFAIRLRMFAEDFVTAHLQNPDAMTILHRDYEGGNAIALEVFNRIFDQILSRFSDFLKKSSQASVLRPDFDVLATTGLLIGSLVHAIRSDHPRKGHPHCSIRDKKNLERFLDQYVAIFCDGLTRRQP